MSDDNRTKNELAESAESEAPRSITPVPPRFIPKGVNPETLNRPKVEEPTESATAAPPRFAPRPRFNLPKEEYERVGNKKSAEVAMPEQPAPTESEPVERREKSLAQQIEGYDDLTEKEKRELEETERRSREFLANAQKRMDSALEKGKKALDKYVKKAQKQNEKDAKKDRKVVEKKLEAFEKGVKGVPMTEECLKAREAYINKLVEIERIRRRTTSTLKLAQTDEERRVLSENLKKLDASEQELMAMARRVKTHGVQQQRSILDEFRELRETYAEIRTELLDGEKGIPHAPQTKESLTKQRKNLFQLIQDRKTIQAIEKKIQNADTSKDRKVLEVRLEQVKVEFEKTKDEVRRIMRYGLNPDGSKPDESQVIDELIPEYDEEIGRKKENVELPEEFAEFLKLEAQIKAKEELQSGKASGEER